MKNDLADNKLSRYGSTFLPVGVIIMDTEPSITFRHPKGRHLFEIEFVYNIFTNKLTYTRSEETGNPLNPYKLYEQNVNEMSTDELKEQILDYMKECNF